MPKKFKSKNMEKLDNPLRRRILPPGDVIKKIDLKKGQKVADVGCGIGYFTIPMAKTVSEEGKVFAIDINIDMLKETKRRVEEEGIINVEMIHSSENNFKIKEKAVDIVFTSTVFHELNSPKDFLNECKRIMKDSGRLIILDWNKVEEEIGPPIHRRKDVEDVKRDVLEEGFDIEKVDYLNSFYIIICQKNINR